MEEIKLSNFFFKIFYKYSSWQLKAYTTNKKSSSDEVQQKFITLFFIKLEKQQRKNATSLT